MFKDLERMVTVFNPIWKAGFVLTHIYKERSFTNIKKKRWILIDDRGNRGLGTVAPSNQGRTGLSFTRVKRHIHGTCPAVSNSGIGCYTLNGYVLDSNAGRECVQVIRWEEGVNIVTGEGSKCLLRLQPVQ